MLSLRRNRAQTPDITRDAGLARTVRALEAAYAIPIPALAFDALAEPETGLGQVRRGRWKSALALAAVALAVTAGFALPALRQGAAPVSAQEILARAVAAPGLERSYHQVYVTNISEVTRIGNGDPVTRSQVQRAEVWYRDAEHARLEIRDVDESGRPGALLSGYIRDGDHVWQIAEDGGTNNGDLVLRVSHGSIRSAIGIFFARGVFSPPLDLKSALKTYWSNCSAPVLRGEADVAGRAAYIVEICGATVWIDKQIYLVLRTEFGNKVPATLRPCESDNAMCTATSLVRSEVTEFATGLKIPNAVFDFQPPPGVFVSEQPDLLPVPDTQTILARVREAAASPRKPFHTVIESGTPQSSYRADIWYSDNSHARSESREFHDGKLTETFGQVRNGTEAWIFRTGQRGAEVWHAANQVEKPLPAVFGGNLLWGEGADGVAAFLEGAVSGCTPVTSSQGQLVLGRATFVVVVGPWIAGCDDPNLRRSEGSSEPEPVRWVLWFDTETYLPLKQESFRPSGERVRPEWKWEVTVLEVGPVDPSVYQYEPPAGAVVTEAGDMP